MDKMRNEFNEAVATGAILQDFFCVTSGYASSMKFINAEWDGKKYKNDELQSAWYIWKASRAALCVELPDGSGCAFESDSFHAYISGIESCKDALDEAGVNHK